MMACASVTLIPGLYDSWVARDICGTPMRVFWPYVKDPVSIERLRDNKPFEVSACWNGMVAFPAGPYMYRPSAEEQQATHDTRHAKRGWKMVDNGELSNAWSFELARLW